MTNYVKTSFPFSIPPYRENGMEKALHNRRKEIPFLRFATESPSTSGGVEIKNDKSVETYLERGGS